jgi:hypothetical protein
MQPRYIRRCHETGPDRRLGHYRHSRAGPRRLLRDQFRWEQYGEREQFTCGEHGLADPDAGGPVPGGSQSAAQGQTAASGSLTPPGTHLAFGGAATVGWVPPSQDTGNGAHEGLKLQVIVLSIQRGTMADFRNVQLNANEQKSTPYYVQLRVTALGSTPPPKDSDPAITFTAIDDRGQEQRGDAHRQAVTWRGRLQRQRAHERGGLRHRQRVQPAEHRLEEVGQRGEGELGLGLGPAGPQDRDRAVAALGQRLEQGRLADPGFAVQHEGAALAAGQRGQQSVEPG